MYEVIKDFNGYKVGDTDSFKNSIAKDLIREGYIKTQTQEIKSEKIKTKERKFTK